MILTSLLPNPDGSLRSQWQTECLTSEETTGLSVTLSEGKADKENQRDFSSAPPVSF